MAAQDIREQTGRKLVIHTWDPEDHKYGPAREFGSGDATLTIWNGSAPGRTPQYSSQNIENIMPPKSDLVVINHGHNSQTPVYAGNGVHGLLEDIADVSENKPAVAVMLQNPETGAHAGSHAAIVERVGEIAARYPNVQSIDAFKPFADAGGLDDLILEDGIHPTNAGYRLWADAFLASLGF